MNKYHNKKVIFQGIKFDSTRERDRYLILKDAELSGIITQLSVHPTFELIPAIKDAVEVQLKTKIKIEERTVQRAITYTADFQYIKSGEMVVEDVKINPKIIPKEYLLKEKLMFWRYRIKIKRVYNVGEEV